MDALDNTTDGNLNKNTAKDERNWTPIKHFRPTSWLSLLKGKCHGFSFASFVQNSEKKTFT